MMTRPIGLAIVLCALLGRSSALGANTEHLEDYARAFVGDWIGEWEMDMTIPGIVTEGDKVVVRATTEWILDKKALRTKWEAEINGKPAGSGITIIGWDRSTSEIVSSGFDSFGGRGESVVSKVGDQWVELGTGVGVDGTKHAIVNSTHIAEDGNSQTIQVIGRLSPEGAPLPTLTIVYKRRGDRN